jgi:uncharacterized protein YukE
MSDAMSNMSASVESASRTVDRTLLDLSGRIAEFSATLGLFAGFQQRMERHETGIIEALTELKTVAERNAGAVGQIEELSRTGKIEFLAAMREMNAPIREAATEITKISVGFAEVCGQLTREVAEASSEQTGKLSEKFTSWRNELNEEAGKAKRALDNLKEPFEESAVQLRAQAANSIHQMETVISGLNQRGDVLLRSLDVVVAPLRELAAKGITVDGADRSREPAVVRLSEDDWKQIQSILPEKITPPPGPVPVPQGTVDGLPPELVGRLRHMDAAFVEIGAALREVAENTRPKPKRSLIDFILRRKPRVRPAANPE